MAGIKSPLSLFTRPPMTAPRPPAGPSAANAGAQIVGAHADAAQVGMAAHSAATSPTRPQVASTPAGMAQQAADTMSTASSAANLGALGQQGIQTITSGLSGRPPPAGLGLMGRLAGGFGPAAAAVNTAVAAHQTSNIMNNPNATLQNKLHAGTTTALTALSGFPNPLVSVPAAITSQLMGMPNVPNAQ